MNQDNDREKRWLAYHLGEVSPEERDSIEKELASSPDKAEEFGRFVQELIRWAKEPVPYTPLGLEDLGIDPPGEKRKIPKRGIHPGKWFWGLAAAALILFALSQTSFSIRMGDFSFSWGSLTGEKQVSELNEKLASLTDEVHLIRKDAVENQTLIQNAVLRNLLLERNMQTAFSQLVYNQQMETRTRYNDFQKLLRINDTWMVNSETDMDLFNQGESFEGKPFLDKSSNHSDQSLQEKR